MQGGQCTCISSKVLCRAAATAIGTAASQPGAVYTRRMASGAVRGPTLPAYQRLPGRLWWKYIACKIEFQLCLRTVDVSHIQVAEDAGEPEDTASLKAKLGLQTPAACCQVCLRTAGIAFEGLVFGTFVSFGAGSSYSQREGRCPYASSATGPAGQASHPVTRHAYG